VNSRLFDLLNVKYVVTSTPFVRDKRLSKTFAQIADNWQRGDVYLPAENLDEEKFKFISSTTHGWYELYENLHHSCLDRQPLTVVDSKGLINVGQKRSHRGSSMRGLVVPLACTRIIFRAAGLFA